MRFFEEYSDAAPGALISAEIKRVVRHPWTLMEVCGGQTHTIMKSGIEDLLPPELTLVHGPGCPVCVTPIEMIDKAVEIAGRPDSILCSFGDMLRVPGSSRSLLDAKAEGADVRIVYSPLDAVRLAQSNPGKQVIFFAVGFETTAPANAMAVWKAAREGVSNFFALVAHVLAPPAMAAIMQSPDSKVQAFLAPGHVCTVMGCEEYEELVARFRIPIVVTGFEPLDILEGIRMTVTQLEQGRATLENQYARAVRREGNLTAKNLISQVFEIVPREWRGIGEIPGSGLRLREEYRAFDADVRFPSQSAPAPDSGLCISGLILQGLRKPYECEAFGNPCTPETPLGAPMVSSEGACAAYYRYGRRQ